ncbi:MAG: hypothetical protein D6679_02430 [Candidatus Hydrogenedentota bacterium]|nr:MAG: hypothetical protein D6679_02430 [Candidatus Hydrogenedentota bacterium]
MIPSEAARSDADEQSPEIADNRLVLPRPSGDLPAATHRGAGREGWGKGGVLAPSTGCLVKGIPHGACPERKRGIREDIECAQYLANGGDGRPDPPMRAAPVSSAETPAPPSADSQRKVLLAWAPKNRGGIII